MAVAGFAILDNHLHLLVRLDPDLARGWSDEDVVRRWGRLFPPRDMAWGQTVAWGQTGMAVPEALTRFPQSILGLLPGLG